MKARENPFATEHVHRLRFRPQGATWDELLRRLAALRYRAAIVGPDGSGKTTFLEDLAPRLEALGFHTKPLRLTLACRTFPRGFLRRFLRELSPDDMILFDGADHMNRLAWRWFRYRARRAAGLVITSHRPGLLPTLIASTTSPALLEELVAQLIGRDAAAREPVARLYQKHNGNLRNALRELYDRYARM